MNIIGLSGAYGSGKNTVVSFMEEYCDQSNLNVKTFAFADPVKEMAEAIDPLVDTEQYGIMRLSELLTSDPKVAWNILEPPTNETRTEAWDRAKKFPDVRRLLQRVGTEAGRGVIRDSLWVDLMDEKVNAARKSGTDVILISDVRFPQEQEFIVNHHGYSILVLRPERKNLGSTAQHSSETSLDLTKIDETIVNSSTLDHLRNEAYSAIERAFRQSSTQ